MSNAIAERAAAIRWTLENHPDRATVRRYSFVAARWEELKLAQIDGRTKPDDDTRLRELGDTLLVLTKQLGFGDKITAWNDFLAFKDPSRLVYSSWIESARLWFP
jgi:hypothetical protein